MALKVPSIALQDNRTLLVRARSAGKTLHAGLQRLKERYACMGEVNGRELMAGVEIIQDRRVGDRADVELGKELSSSMMKKGLSTMLSARDTFSGCIRIAPPIVITDEELEWALEVMEKAFSDCARSVSLQ